MTVTIMDKTFDIIKENQNKTFEKESIPDLIWNDLIMHSNLGTGFVFNQVEYSVRYLYGKITVMNVEEYREQRKQAVKTQLKDYEKLTLPQNDEHTQDDSRNKPRYASFWS